MIKQPRGNSLKMIYDNHFTNQRVILTDKYTATEYTVIEEQECSSID